MTQQVRRAASPYPRIRGLAGHRSGTHPTPLPVWQRLLLGTADLVLVWLVIAVAAMGLERQSLLQFLAAGVVLAAGLTGMRRLRWHLADRRTRRLAARGRTAGV